MNKWINCTITKETPKGPRRYEFEYRCEACSKDIVGVETLHFDINDSGYAMGASLVICVECIKKALEAE